METIIEKSRLVFYIMLIVTVSVAFFFVFEYYQNYIPPKESYSVVSINKIAADSKSMDLEDSNIRYKHECLTFKNVIVVSTDVDNNAVRVVAKSLPDYPIDVICNDNQKETIAKLNDGDIVDIYGEVYSTNPEWILLQEGSIDIAK